MQQMELFVMGSEKVGKTTFITQFIKFNGGESSGALAQYKTTIQEPFDAIVRFHEQV